MEDAFDDNKWPFGCEVAPGLFVDGLGAISTPLFAEQAENLIALCEKSPFGHNMDTKMDDNVRKSWQLQPNLVKFKNPLWQTGIKNLSKNVATRLGYREVLLKCLLYKLLVYGEGGHFVKHQDTEKEDGMIATLVVQPPSTHEGGDLVVYRDGEVNLWSLSAYGRMTKEGGYVGNESSEAVSTYTRYAIVAWPAAKHVDKAFKFMPMDAAAEALHLPGLKYCDKYWIEGPSRLVSAHKLLDCSFEVAFAITASNPFPKQSNRVRREQLVIIHLSRNFNCLLDQGFLSGSTIQTVDHT
ncbi:uncharacterized protein PITG_07081 [Phytophthora infestans T30-4]|uniref:Prolyl 4-hydroxylase alpha subunit Fe(2+) 2OG dioxygenase domain-containing protein n=1 Tax=Phytophthora infestans (strain T30-4) TaxID=403677 RepID=D0N779_PHYIT|nr:uncharacterized protein PITG_07081 [Phytophthora infestans T30-4]EEY53428.1 conserved hypothetical protein [Phytophthora infestans T30-4]|eukprot:XP_002905046.1 conserved hypothetical protein [Phytophthora infestans T30-4]